MNSFLTPQVSRYIIFRMDKDQVEVDKNNYMTISELKQKYHGKRLTTDEAAVAGNAIQDGTFRLEDIQYKTGKDHLLLKFGTLKSVALKGAEGKRLFEEYSKLGTSSSGVVNQKDSPEQKDLMCRMIDECDGTIRSDWDGNNLTKLEAKKYLMEYGNGNTFT